jgi:hypothetical protein
MFICQQCERRTEPGEKAHMRVVETHPYIHPPRSYFLRGEREPRKDRGGAGTQIVCEIRVCAVCASG